MIQKKTESGAVTIIILPGGPGLSSTSVGDLSALSSKFELCPIDLPGDAGERSYEGLLGQIESEIQGVEGKIVLCGHSFGGIQAADLAIRHADRVAALICLSTPFSGKTFEVAGHQYESYMTPQLKASELTFRENPTNDNFRAWLAEYGELYFSRPFLQRGREMLLRETVDARVFLGARLEGATKESLLSGIRGLHLPKLFLHGESDRLLPLAQIRSDADAGDFRLRVIPNAGHFIAVENPEQVAHEIDEFLDGVI